MSGELRLKVATVWRGEWSAEVAYNVLDEVSFSAEAEGVKRGNYRSLLAANREPLGNENAWVLVLDLEKTLSATEEAEGMNEAFASAESGRVEAENKRVTAESGRVEAEGGRVKAEGGRESAEIGRVSAESGRAEAETNRRTTEETRISNEQARKSAEAGRVKAESKRVSSEQLRITAENGRIAAEADRVNAFAVAQNEREEAFNEAEAGRDAKIDAKVEDITRLQGEVAKKANIDGYYSSMAVGVAESLIGQNVTTQQFTYQPSGNNLDVQDGLAVVKSIKGNTMVANQICNKIPVSLNRVVVSVRDNGIVDIVCNNTSNFSKVFGNFKCLKGRKYLVNITSSKFLVGPNNKPFLGFYMTTLVPGSLAVITSPMKKIFIANQDSNENIIVSSYFGLENQLLDFTAEVKIQIIDLTQMFGEGNEPASVEEFERLYPNLPIEFNEGSLLNLNADSIKSVGFNAYNGEYAKVLGGMQYYLGGNITSLTFKENLEDEGEVIEIPSDNLYTPDTNGFLVASGSDICINLSHSGYRNGEYEPYKESIVNLPIKKYFPDGMKSAGAIRDEIVWDEGLKKYKAIQRIDTRAYQTGDEDLENVRTDKTNTYYILKTPIETIIYDYDGLNYEVSDFGTEEIIADEPTAPIIVEVAYGVNAVDTLRRLPQNYISTDSMRDFLAQLGSAMGGSWTMVFDDVNNKWLFSFEANAVVTNEEKTEI